MRLLFLSNFYPPHELGGMEQLCHEVTVRLRQRGHCVSVLTSQYHKGGQVVDEANVSRALHLQADIYYYSPSGFFLRRRRRELENSAILHATIQEMQPDLVVVWGMWNMSRKLPHLAEQWMPGRIAYYIASTWPIDRDIHEKYWQLPASARWSQALKHPFRAVALAQLHLEGYPPGLRFDDAMCCSRFLRNALVAGGALPASSGVIYNGIDPRPFLSSSPRERLSPGAPLHLLYFGTLIRQKGVHTAIAAIGLLKSRGKGERVRLTILGKGHPAYEDELRAMTADLDLGEQVRFAGRVPREEVPRWLRRADVFLFTSTGPEAMARTVMEAMAAGLLVIGTQAGGQAEMLVDRENSLMFRPDDSEGLANCIEVTLESPLLCRGLARAGKELVLSKFTLDRMVDEVEAWLGGMLSRATQIPGRVTDGC